MSKVTQMIADGGKRVLGALWDRAVIATYNNQIDLAERGYIYIRPTKEELEMGIVYDDAPLLKYVGEGSTRAIERRDELVEELAAYRARMKNPESLSSDIDETYEAA